MSTLLRGPATVYPIETLDLAPDPPEFEQLAHTPDSDYFNVDHGLALAYADIANEDAGIQADFQSVFGLLLDANAIDTANGLLDDTNEFSDLLGFSDLLDTLVGSLF